MDGGATGIRASGPVTQQFELFVVAEASSSKFLQDSQTDERFSQIGELDENCKMIATQSLQPWPTLFHNLRSSRQTELEESCPSQVVCALIGNSEKAARKRYLQLTEAHFGKASGSAWSALQNPAQHASEMQRTGSQLLNTSPEKSQKTQEFATDCDAMPCTEIAVVGLEPTTYGL